MRSYISLLIVFFFAAGTMHAQLETPAPSPFSTLEQRVGLTDITIEYSRPGVKDRTIFGGLLSFGEMWRVGANASTKIAFSDDVQIMGNELEAGKYALYMIPGENEWEVIFYENTEYSGTPGDKYSEDEVAVSVNVEPEALSEEVETMLLDINNIRNSSADLQLRWQNTLISVPFTVPTDNTVEANISDIMSGPSSEDYFSAAGYYYDQGKDLNQALAWVNKAIKKSDEDHFFVWRLKSEIEADLGQYNEAIMSAKKSKKLAMEADNEFYINMNEKNIKKWKKMK